MPQFIRRRINKSFFYIKKREYLFHGIKLYKNCIPLSISIFKTSIRHIKIYRSTRVCSFQLMKTEMKLERSLTLKDNITSKSEFVVLTHINGIRNILYF